MERMTKYRKGVSLVSWRRSQPGGDGRMVERRTRIGTMKALSYGKKDIASKYLKYAFYATMGGSIFGVLVGEKIFPLVIINSYSIMYQSSENPAPV